MRGSDWLRRHQAAPEQAPTYSSGPVAAGGARGEAFTCKRFLFLCYFLALFMVSMQKYFFYWPCKSMDEQREVKVGGRGNRI